MAEAFDSWAIVEVMGHNRFAGRVSEQAIGGASFVRIDVPEVERSGQKFPGFTKLFGGGAIYSITPVTEETARGVAATIHQQPMNAWDAREYLAGLPAPTDSPKFRCRSCGCAVAPDCDYCGECLCEDDGI